MEIMSKPIRFLLFFILLFVALYYARAIIIPVCFAGLLAMLFLPLCRKMESKGIGRGLASFICVLIFLAALAGIFSLLSWQLTDLSKDMTGIEQKITSFVEKAKQYIHNTFGVSPEEQKK